jgi:hypothetical protein
VVYFAQVGDGEVREMSQLAPEMGLGTGVAVEVWNEFLNRWSHGFEVEEVAGTDFRLRRRSDGEVLPQVFPGSRLRRAAPRSG